MKCPKCDYNRQKRDDAFVPLSICPNCSVVYIKYEGIPVPGLPLPTDGLPAGHRSSALDPETLKKTRERIEKRLRSRQELPEQDERQTGIQESARKPTGTGPNKREKVPAFPEKIETATAPKQDMKQDGADPEFPDTDEEILLLEEVVGVQIHEATDAAPSVENKTAQDETETPAKALRADSDDETTGEVDSNATAQLQPEDPLQEDDDDFDVQLETVVLVSPRSVAPESAANDPKVVDITTLPRPDTESPAAYEPPPAHIAAQSQMVLNAARIGNYFKRLLPIVAWMMLLTGIIGAIFSWTTINDVQAGVKIPVIHGQNTLPLGLLLGLAYLAIGALGFAFFRAAGMINSQLKEIRCMLNMRPSQGASPAVKDHECPSDKTPDAQA